MTDAQGRLFIWGFLTATVIWIGGMQLRDEAHDAQLEAQRDSTRLWQDSSALHGRAIDHYRVQLAAANDRVNELLHSAAVAVAAVEQRSSRVHVVAVAQRASAGDTAARFMEPRSDTTALAGVQRRGVDPLPWLVPAFVVAEWQFAVTTVFALDTVIQAQREMGRRAQLVITAFDSRRRADSLWIRSLVAENAILQTQRQRCGRRCGIVIGVTGAVATLYIASRIFDASRPPRPPALRVALRLRSL